MIGKRAFTGNLIECKRQYPRLQILRGFTLIDNLIDLDVTGAYKRLAVGDGEFGKRLTITYPLAMVASDDASINPVEDALCIDRIVLTGNTSLRAQVLALIGRWRIADPDAVGNLRGVADSIQWTIVENLNLLIGFVDNGQNTRGRTVVHKATGAFVLINQRCNTVFLGFLLCYSRNLATEMTVADGSLVLVGNAGAVLGGRYDACDA